MTAGGLATVILTDAMAVIIMVLGGAVLSVIGVCYNINLCIIGMFYLTCV